VLGIQFQHPLVSRNRLSLGVGIFFERNALGEKPSDIGGNRSGLDQRGRSTGNNIVSGGEIEHELARDRLYQFALVAESNAMAGAENARLDQRILHPRSLFLHGIKRLPDYRRAHFMSAQVANLLDLQEVKKGIVLGDGYQFGFFPSCQLTRRKPKNPKQICSTVSVHVDKKRSAFIIRSWGCVGKWK
jgi:hypothetical protein